MSGTAQRVDFLLEKIGAPVAEHFARAAKEAVEPAGRAYAVRRLGGLAKYAAARAAIREALADRAPEVRVAAAEQLVRSGVEKDRAIEVLGRGVRAGEREAVTTLLALGEKAEPAVPDLLAVLFSNRDTAFRRWVVHALGRIALDRPEVRSALERIAADEDEDSGVRSAARNLIKD